MSNAPAAGYFTKRLAEDWLRGALEEARAGVEGSGRLGSKLLIQMHGILRRARKLYGLSGNAADVEKFPQRHTGDIEVVSPEEIWALVRAAASLQDAAVSLTAAFTGRRMGELLVLRWRDVDFAGQTIRVRASYSAGQLTTPKSGKLRAVPMAPDGQRPGRARPARVPGGRGRSRVRRGVGLLPRWLGAPSPVQGGARRRRSAPAALPRSAPHARDADDRQGGHPAGAGVDGPADVVHRSPGRAGPQVSLCHPRRREQAEAALAHGAALRPRFGS